MDHAGLSQLLVLWKDYTLLRLVNWKSSQNKHWLTAQKMEMKDAMVV